jgi:hypothetical protein
MLLKDCNGCDNLRERDGILTCIDSNTDGSEIYYTPIKDIPDCGDFYQSPKGEKPCCVCGKQAEGKDTCDCICPVCGVHCFDDVTLEDHCKCIDCHHAELLKERE